MCGGLRWCILIIHVCPRITTVVFTQSLPRRALHCGWSTGSLIHFDQQMNSHKQSATLTKSHSLPACLPACLACSLEVFEERVEVDIGKQIHARRRLVLLVHACAARAVSPVLVLALAPVLAPLALALDQV